MALITIHCVYFPLLQAVVVAELKHKFIDCYASKVTGPLKQTSTKCKLTEIKQAVGTYMRPNSIIGYTRDVNVINVIYIKQCPSTEPTFSGRCGLRP